MSEPTWFCMQLMRVAEPVQLFGPQLYANNPPAKEGDDDVKHEDTDDGA